MQRWSLILTMLILLFGNTACGKQQEGQPTSISSRPLRADVEETTGKWHFEEAFPAKWIQEPGESWMALDSNDHPHLVYGGDHLYHAWFDGDEWKIETVDARKGQGRSAALAFDSAQRLHIAYAGGKLQNLALYYAYQGPSGWVQEVIDPSFCFGRGVSIKISAQDEPVLVYDASPSCHESSIDRSDLRVATRANNQWVRTILSQQGMYPSLAVDSKGQPHISFMDAASGSLYYARRQGADWFSMQIQQVGQYSGPTSLELDQRDLPHIFYYNEGLFSPTETAGYYLARQNEDGSWITVLIEANNSGGDIAAGVDSSNLLHAIISNRLYLFAQQPDGSWEKAGIPYNDQGAGYLTLAIDSQDNVHLAFFKYLSSTLTYATQTKNGWQLIPIDRGVDVDYGYGDLAIDSQGEFHIAFHDQSGNVYYALRDAEGWHHEIVSKGSQNGLQQIDLIVDSHNIPYLLFENGDPKETGVEGPLIFAYQENERWSKEGIPVNSQSFGRRSPLVISPDGFPTLLITERAAQLGWIYRTPAGWQKGGFPDLHSMLDQNPVLSFDGAAALDQDSPALPSTIGFIQTSSGKTTTTSLVYTVSDGKKLTNLFLPYGQWIKWTLLAMGNPGGSSPTAVFVTHQHPLPGENELEEDQIRYFVFTQNHWEDYWLPLTAGEMVYPGLIDQQGTAHLLLKYYGEDHEKSIYLFGKGMHWQRMEVSGADVSTGDLVPNAIAVRPDGQVCGLFIEESTLNVLVGCLGNF